MNILWYTYNVDGMLIGHQPPHIWTLKAQWEVRYRQDMSQIML